MTETFNLITGMLALILGIPIGDFLAKHTKEELKAGKKWFKLIIVFSFAGSIISLIFRNDALLFSFLFMAIVTSRSLKENKRSK